MTFARTTRRTGPARRRRGGFTLIEVMVSTTLVAIAVVGALQGITAIQAGDAHAQTADLLQRLAAEKVGDIRILSDPGTGAGQGDFADRGYPDIAWTADVQTTNATYVDQVTVTATEGRQSQSLTTMVFVPPTTTTTTTGSGATGTTGGGG